MDSDDIKKINNTVKNAPKYEPGESVHDYDSDESPEDYDPSTWNSNLEVKYHISFNCKTKNQILKVKNSLERNGFFTTDPIREHKRWHSVAKCKILIKEYEEVDKLAHKVLAESCASMGYGQVDKFCEEIDKQYMQFNDIVHGEDFD